jgi:CRISPR-associated endonuclease Csy4
MKYYQEITLLNTFDIDIKYIFNKFFKDLHLEFVIFQKNNGYFLPLSFPEYNLELGDIGKKLRIFFDSEDDFKNLNLKNKLRRYDDYIHFSKIRMIPNEYKFGVFCRKQSKSNVIRLARRYAKRKNVDFDCSINLHSELVSKYICLPYIDLKSLSTSRSYKLFVDFHFADQEIIGKFNSFGLGTKATVPIF